MRVLFYFPVAAFVLGLSGCSSSSGSASGTTDRLHPETYVNSQPAGRFQELKSVPLGQWGTVPDGFEVPGRVSCAGKILFAFDPRLQANDVVRRSHANATLTGVSRFTETQTILSLSANEVVKVLRDSNIQTTPAINGMPSEIQLKQVCALTGDAQNPIQCSINSVNGVSLPEPPPLQDCYLRDHGSDPMQTSGSVSLGRYTLEDGKTVRAQRTQTTIDHGEIVCRLGEGSESVIGAGRSMKDSIQTVDVVSTEPDCDHVTELYQLMTLQLNNGAIVSMTQSEILSAPQR